MGAGMFSLVPNDVLLCISRLLRKASTISWAFTCKRIYFWAIDALDGMGKESSVLWTKLDGSFLNNRKNRPTTSVPSKTSVKVAWKESAARVVLSVESLLLAA